MTNIQKRGICLALIVLVGLAAYGNSFSGVFLFDDIPHIVNNFDIRTLDFPWPFLSTTRRPLLYLSLAVNYHLGGLDPWGYHLFNLVVHLISGCLLFLLLTGGPARRAPQTPPWTAGLAALLWVVHPLNTQSVTYIIQRAESFAGMFYLLCLLCAQRFFLSGKKHWAWCSLGACVLGGLTKETLITAPLVVLLYDRAFVSPSFQTSFKKNGWFYAGFILPAGMMLTMFLSMRTELVPSAGFGLKMFTPLQYALTQPGVVLYYLRLSVWPYPLLIDHPWPVAQGFGDALPALPVVLLLIAAAVWTYRRFPRVGFLALSFFIILLPSSSFIPLKDPVFEHRLYLSLACLITLFVFGADRALNRLIRDPFSRRDLKSVLAFFLVAGMIFLTVDRNRDYHGHLAMWEDAIQKYPDNCRAQNNLGQAYAREARYDLAEIHYRKSVELCPDFPHANNNLGVVLLKREKYEQALGFFQHAAQANPLYDSPFNNIGVIYIMHKRFAEAEPYFRRAIELNSNYAKAYNNLGVSLREQGKEDEARECFLNALRLDPDYPEAKRNFETVNGD